MRLTYMAFVMVSLLGDFLGAYRDAFLSVFFLLRRFYKAIVRILTDIKFWLVFCVACLAFVIPFACILSYHEYLLDTKIDVHVVLSDGREFVVNKSDMNIGENSIEFTTKDGETIKTTLFTINYLTNSEE